MGFHLLRSFQAPSLLARLFFLFDFFLRAALLLASEGSHSLKARLLGIFPTPLPLDNLAAAAAAALEPAAAAPEAPAEGAAAPGSIGGADFGASGWPGRKLGGKGCLEAWPEVPGATGAELGANDDDDEAAAAAADAAAAAAAVAAAASGECPSAVAPSAAADDDDPGGAMHEAVSTISSSKRFRLMARELEKRKG